MLPRQLLNHRLNSCSHKAFHCLTSPYFQNLPPHGQNPKPIPTQFRAKRKVRNAPMELYRARLGLSEMSVFGYDSAGFKRDGGIKDDSDQLHGRRTTITTVRALSLSGPANPSQDGSVVAQESWFGSCPDRRVGRGVRAYGPAVFERIPAGRPRTAQAGSL